MLKHKEQRIGILVDVANVYHSAKNLYGKKASFNEILKEAVADRKLIRATAYAIRTENNEEAPFIEALEQQGFEVKLKDLQIFAGGSKKGDWDVGITIDALKLANKLDVIVIVSGDGDYLPLVSYLQNNKGCLVEIMAFKKTCSSKLIEEADDFTDLSAEKRFLINDNYSKNKKKYKQKKN
ncbi:MAG: NYN domain-containing protein [Patescibacteria group bacterium]|jgi:uncharacterized LabA/DUF88 family protein|nr:NYN domain-containing protein [Patescibacteria group bacterium]